jgi:hypothetical protein
VVEVGRVGGREERIKYLEGGWLEEKTAMILGFQQNIIIVQALPAKYYHVPYLI